VADDDLRDEIEAEIEAATLTEEEDEEAEEAEEAVEAASPAGQTEDGGGSGRRRRRRRRRGGRKKKALEGTFDHGDTDGFGLWLDPAIQDEPTYTEHWAGHRAVEVEVEPDRIVIRRSE
jgi:hypothetical protein